MSRSDHAGAHHSHPPPKASPSHREADPSMADTHHISPFSSLTRSYISISPSLQTHIIEENPPRPPKKIDLFRKNRSFQLQLAERNDWWFSDPVKMLWGGKAKKKDQESLTQAEKAKDEEEAKRNWEFMIKDDIRVLWDDIAVLENKEGKKKEEVLYAFFRVCREKLEDIEEMGKGVALSEFQIVVRETLVEMRLKLERSKLQILREMATERKSKKS